MKTNSFIENLRSAFKDADEATKSYGPMYAMNEDDFQLIKRSEKDILDHMTFANDDEVPRLGYNGRLYVDYVPFSWNEGGDKHSGYLIMDPSYNNRIYGLERDDGVSMSAQGTRKMLEKMVYGDKKAQDEKNVTNGIRKFFSLLRGETPEKDKFEPLYSNRFSDPRTTILNRQTFNPANDTYGGKGLDQVIPLIRRK